MGTYLSIGAGDTQLTPERLRELLFAALAKLGPRKNVLAVPPDYSRVHSGAGHLTRYAFEYYGERLRCILPATGTHAALTDNQRQRMFGAMPASLFRAHDWRDGLACLGEVPLEFIREQSEGKLGFPWPAQVNHLITGGGFDLILSIGQVVPHEVIGMANQNKNILIGAGGIDSINRSHYLGAVYGMERIMGRADTPVRRVLNYAAEKFLQHLPIVYVLTVVARAADGSLVTRGLYVGDDNESFLHAAALSLRVNFEVLEKPIRKAVVRLAEDQYKSTWLGNKAIYRTRMAMADGGELIVLAPGVREFGEDLEIDALIRKYGYRGTPATLQAVERDPELQRNLGAAAHLIHGSSEGRFTITYAPGKLTRDEVENVGFRFGDLRQLSALYDCTKLRDGYNTIAGEEIFYIAHPGMGLWAGRARLLPPPPGSQFLEPPRADALQSRQGDTM